MSPLARVRATLKDPLYRHEVKQAQAGRLGYELTITTLLCLSGVGIPAVLILAPIWISEAVFQERQGETLDGLLLTTVDRERLLWAKLLSRVRPLMFVMTGSGAIGSVVAVLICRRHSPLNWSAVGALGGLVLGASLVGGGIARGAYGLAAAVRTRSRLRVTARAVWSPFFLVLFEVLVLVLLVSIFWAGGYAEEDSKVIVVAVVATLLAGLLVAAKVIVLNLHIAATAIEKLASTMDELLIDGQYTPQQEEPMPVEDVLERREAYWRSWALANRDVDIRYQAVQELRELKDKSGMKSLVICLRDEHPAIRAGAAQALGEMGWEESEAALVQALEDDDPEVRATVAHALGLMEASAGQADLVSLLSDDNAEVRGFAAWAISRNKADPGDVLPALRKALEDEAREVRIRAAEAVGHARSRIAVAVEALTKSLADDDWEVRASSAFELGVIGSAAAPSTAALEKQLEDPDRRAALVAHGALWRITGEGAEGLRALTEGLEDPDVRVRDTATYILGEIGPAARDAIPALESALKDSEDNVRKSAAEALKKIRAAKGETEGPASGS